MEEKPRQTLQSRITNFIIIFVILLISAFTIIQVNNQIKTITNYNSYRAKISTLFFKIILEKILQSIEPGADVVKPLNEYLASLKKGGLIEAGGIISKYGDIVASTDPSEVGKKTKPRERLKVRNLLRSKGKETSSDVDKATKTLFIYIPLEVPGAQKYAMRAAFSLGNTQEALQQVYIPIAFTVVSVIGIAVIFAFMLSKNIVGPVIILNKATKNIAGGNLDMRVKLKTGDELEELASTFNDMTIALKKMKDRAENANPLTKLPGNNVIREQVENRIKDNRKFVVVHTDLDNFKAFNDKYGIHKGDDAITLSATIMQEALKEKGAPDDFIGHEGGDDFVFITTPEKADAVASHMIQKFDKEIRVLYDEKDLKQGHIIAKGRDGKISQFPIMSVSLSGVTNAIRPITSYAEVTNIVAGVKKKAKAIEGSAFVLDKREETSSS